MRGMVGAMITVPAFDASIKPIFIIGAPRSGTSITSWALGQHPNIQVIPESAGWIAALAIGAYLSYGYGTARGRHSHLSNAPYELAHFMRRVGESAHAITLDCFEERCHRLYGDFRNNARLAVPEGSDPASFQVRRGADEKKDRWVDATPFNTGFIWALSSMFPQARFIHNLRRPHEVATSLEGFDNLGLEPHVLADGLAIWREHTENAWLGERALGAEKVFRLDYERISAEPEPLLRELCEFLGEEFHQACLLPLTQRINSSGVDDRREENLRRLQAMPEYAAAQALFEQITAAPVAASPDATANQELRTRFEEYCRHRSLI
jgi:hypothetical protein